jgi:hypothetical protein
VDWHYRCDLAVDRDRDMQAIESIAVYLSVEETGDEVASLRPNMNESPCLFKFGHKAGIRHGENTRVQSHKRVIFTDRIGIEIPSWRFEDGMLIFNGGAQTGFDLVESHQTVLTALDGECWDGSIVINK